VDVSAAISAQINHSRQFLGAPASVAVRPRGHVMPHVFINAQRGDTSEPGLVGIGFLEEGADRFPNGSPTSAPLPAEPVDGRVFTAQLPDGPLAGPGRQFGPRPRDLGVLLDKGAHFAG
jgi:hypothetical protein